jgi:hypothetical protein
MFSSIELYWKDEPYEHARIRQGVREGAPRLHPASHPHYLASYIADLQLNV